MNSLGGGRAGAELEQKQQQQQQWSSEWAQKRALEPDERQGPAASIETWESVSGSSGARSAGASGSGSGSGWWSSSVSSSLGSAQVPASKLGRLTPSQMVARKQQLLAGANGPHELALKQPNEKQQGGSAGLNGSISAGNQQHKSQGAAEIKLESLSALVREKQQDEHNQLDDFEREGAENGDPAAKLESLYILLSKKEKDLQLAAELGKVLLERNDELSKANEKITEEYSHKLELLEQEKHKLRRKLDLLSGEYENRLVELQTDCNILKNKLDQKDQSSRQFEREKTKLIDDLVQQNQRLTRELAEATKSEELLSGQLEQLNERMNARLSNTHDHAAQVHALQDELQVLSQRKQDLERRLKLAQSDKSNLSATIEESNGRILLLENVLNERESRLNELILEVDELRDSSAWLAAKLESMISLNERICNQSENQLEGAQLDTSGPEVLGAELRALSDKERSQLIEQLKELRFKTSSRIRASNELLLMQRHNGNLRRNLKANSINGISAQLDSANFETDLDEESSSYESGSREGASRVAGKSPNRSRPHRSGSRGEPTRQDLIGEIYLLLKRFQLNLQQRKDELLQRLSNGGSGANGQQSNGLGAPATTTSSSMQSSVPHGGAFDDSGILGDTMVQDGSEGPSDTSEWKQLLANLRALIEEIPCTNCHLMIAERNELEQLQKRHNKLSEQLKAKDEQLLQLEALKLEQSTRLDALEERCKTLEQDLDSCQGNKSKEEIVRLAWQARDEAVARKNAAEIALAKTRIENMQISSQLMEVVQQKGELSQKLAQFEDDIHYMMQRSVRNKLLTWEEFQSEQRGRRRANREGQTTGLNLNERLTNTTSTVISNFGQSSIMQISQLLNSIGAQKESSDNNGAEDSEANTRREPKAESSASNSDSSQQSPTSAGRNLFANIKANRFNLRFWQASGKSPDTSPPNQETTYIKEENPTN